MGKIKWPKNLSTAEMRGYQQICDRDGKILVIALDQRNGMRNLASDNEAERAKITEAVLGEIKADIVQFLGNHAPAVLLDPICALPKIVDEGTLARDCALVIGMDASGWETDEETGTRQTQLVEGISARRVRELGGTAGKLMTLMRPDKEGEHGYAAQMINKTVKEFQAEDLLLVVEILIYRFEDEDVETYNKLRPSLILDAAKTAMINGAKVLKLQYPGSAEGCAKVSQALKDIPWALLSDGVDHETYLKQLKIAIENGASGAIAGRALWKDCVSLDAGMRKSKLENLGIPRLTQIQSVLDGSK